MKKATSPAKELTEMPYDTTTPPNFQRLNIAAGGTIHNAIVERRVLRSTLRDHTFIIAHAEQRALAFALAADTLRHGPAYTVLLTDEHLAGIQAGNPRQDVDVHVAHMNHSVTGKIKVNDGVGVMLRTEHGEFICGIATTRDLRAGDLFVCGDFAVDGRGREHGLVVYRALADCDSRTGTVERHIVTRHWDDASPADRANLTSILATGPDHIVHRVASRAAFLSRLGLHDLAD